MITYLHEIWTFAHILWTLLSVEGHPFDNKIITIIGSTET